MQQTIFLIIQMLVQQREWHRGSKTSSFTISHGCSEVFCPSMRFNSSFMNPGWLNESLGSDVILVHAHFVISNAICNCLNCELSVFPHCIKSFSRKLKKKSKNKTNPWTVGLIYCIAFKLLVCFCIYKHTKSKWQHVYLFPVSSHFENNILS